MGAIGEVDSFKIAKKEGGDNRETAVNLKGCPPDFYFGVFAGTHTEEVPPGTNIGGNDDGGFGFVGQEGTGGLTDFFPEVGFT